MAVANPLTKEQVTPETHEIYNALTQELGKVPNVFATMAHRPDVLNKFVPLYGAIIQGGTVKQRYKELAYLKTSLINGCEY